MFGDKNHIGIDRHHGFVRRFTVTHAARHDGAQLGALLDRGNLASSVWADAAYRSQANLRLMDRRSLVAQFQRAKPRGRPMPKHIAQGNPGRDPAVLVASWRKIADYYRWPDADAVSNRLSIFRLLGLVGFDSPSS
ncbi:MAG: transposase [Proteobacteria bacterium]|nr:transposase [Pseudomonadota bacterium]